MYPFYDVLLVPLYIFALLLYYCTIFDTKRFGDAEISIVGRAHLLCHFYTFFSNITLQRSVPILCTEYYVILYIVFTM